MTGVFPSVLKDSKLDYSNYSPISLLSNIEEILENVSIGDYIPSLITNILSNDLQFGFTQQYALINITENIRKALDDGNIGCGKLNQAIKFCKVHHFVDDTNLLFISQGSTNCTHSDKHAHNMHTEVFAYMKLHARKSIKTSLSITPIVFKVVSYFCV